MAASPGARKGQKNQTGQQNRRNMEALQKRFQQRITHVKYGKEAMNKNNQVEAIKFYNMYLRTISEVFDIDEKNLSPKHFDKKKDIPEMLLISHIYWDLAKIYDRAPNLYPEFKRCLNKFVQFTSGLPYQIINSEILRKFIRKGRLVNTNDYKEAYRQIYVASKKCFVATLCFGEDHPVTEDLRVWRDKIIETKMGELFVRNYYKYSPGLVDFCRQNPTLERLSIKFFKPIIAALHKFIY